MDELICRVLIGAAMTPAQRQLVETVLQRFGAKAATTDAEAIAPWLSDWRGRYHGQAPALPKGAWFSLVLAGLAGCLDTPGRTEASS